MNMLLQDLRFALRQLRRSPGFALTAVLTLALGVGANTAIFSLMDQALLRSLPVQSPNQLVILQGTGKAWNGRSSSHGGDISLYFSYPMYRDLQARATAAFSGLIATSPASIGVARNGSADVVDGELVSGDYFRVLGVPPALGRLLNDSDDTAPGANPVAVLSYAYWRDHLGADRSIVGQTLTLNGHPFVIVGVAAPLFQSAVWGQTPRLFVPMSMLDMIVPGDGVRLQRHNDRWLNVVGRLRDGVTASTAQVQMAPLWHALRADELKAMGTRSPRFVDSFLTKSQLLLLPGARGLSYSREGLEKPLLAVMGMAVLVLLIATVNVASLLLVRSAARVREFALRYAVGASARRVLSQLLLEGLLIGLLGATLGVMGAPLAVRVLARRLASGDATFFTSGVDGRLLLFSFGVALLVSVLFSFAPAARLLKPDLVGSLKQQAGTAGAARLGFRRAIVGLQVGLSVLLLVGAGLFVRTLQNLRLTNPGFTPSGLITFGIDPQLAGEPPEHLAALHRQIQDALAAVPGVQSVGVTTSAELAGSDSGGNVTVEGYTPPQDEDLDIGRAQVSPGYFNTLKIPIVAGRAFTETDDLQHPAVAIVNESFARHYFGNDAAAVGRRMARGGGKNLAWMQIVGVSRDILHTSLRDSVKMTDYIPIAQDAKTNGVQIYLRAAPSTAMFASIRRAMQQVSPRMALQDMRTMDAQIEESLSNERLIGLLAASFGVLATLLAGIGLYGVLAYTTAQRTREIGVRMALGATRMGVATLVLMDVVKLAGVGVIIALPCAALLARAVRSQLYGVSPADPLTLCSVTVLLSVVALVSALVPARRASHISPNEALRSE